MGALPSNVLFSSLSPRMWLRCWAITLCCSTLQWFSMDRMTGYSDTWRWKAGEYWEWVCYLTLVSLIKGESWYAWRLCSGSWETSRWMDKWSWALICRQMFMHSGFSSVVVLQTGLGLETTFSWSGFCLRINCIFTLVWLSWTRGLKGLDFLSRPVKTIVAVIFLNPKCGKFQK